MDDLAGSIPLAKDDIAALIAENEGQGRVSFG
jgi:hypothetical protein